MKYGVYCIQDAVAEEFLSPVLHPSDAVARRSFENVVLAQGDSSGPLYTHASGYTLYKVADFDSELAQFDAVVPVQYIVNAGNVVAQMFSKEDS